MSNKTQLQTNNTSLEALITRVNTAKNTAASLPEVGSGGSGTNIDTCSVTITCAEAGIVTGYGFTIFENNQITSIGSFEATVPVTINNVVCGSMISVTQSYMLPGFTSTNGSIEFIAGYSAARCFKLTAEAGSSVTIDIYNAD